MAFNRHKAVAYARQYALTYNPAYRTFPNDCTNFVSQAMLAGGWTQVDGPREANNVWWYSGGFLGLRVASYTWGGAQNFYNFLSVSGRGTLAQGPADLDLGDVVQMRNGGTVHHTMIVTGKNGNDLLLSYHTSNHLDESLQAIQARSAGEEFIYWKIK
jgi:hypothetical protein